MILKLNSALRNQVDTNKGLQIDANVAVTTKSFSGEQKLDPRFKKKNTRFGAANPHR